MNIFHRLVSTRLVSLTVLAAILGATGVACGGAVGGVDDDAPPTEPGGGGGGGESESGSGSGSESGTPASTDPGTLPLPPAVGASIPIAGACAVRTSGPLPGDDSQPSPNQLGCKVATERTDSWGHVAITMVNGDRGRAGLTDGTLVLLCGDGERLLLEAAVRCYQGQGSYDIAAGDLKLGGKVSDRPCRLSLDTRSDRVEGFVSCDTDPVDPSNVFASTTAPIGLGFFSVTRVP